MTSRSNKEKQLIQRKIAVLLNSREELDSRKSRLQFNLPSISSIVLLLYFAAKGGTRLKIQPFKLTVMKHIFGGSC